MPNPLTPTPADLEWLRAREREVREWAARADTGGPDPDGARASRDAFLATADRYARIAGMMEQAKGAVATARQALEDIADPLSAMQRVADAEGTRLNGYAAVLADDPAHLKRIAERALAELRPVPR